MFAWIRDRGMGKPTQIIWGRNDPTAPLEQGYALFDLIAATEPRCQAPDHQPRGGTIRSANSPEIFNEMLRGFIQASLVWTRGPCPTDRGSRRSVYSRDERVEISDRGARGPPTSFPLIKAVSVVAGGGS